MDSGTGCSKSKEKCRDALVGHTQQHTSLCKHDPPQSSWISLAESFIFLVQGWPLHNDWRLSCLPHGDFRASAKAQTQKKVVANLE